MKKFKSSKGREASAAKKTILSAEQTYTLTVHCKHIAISHHFHSRLLVQLQFLQVSPSHIHEKFV